MDLRALPEHGTLLAGLGAAAAAPVEVYLSTARRMLERMVAQPDWVSGLALERKPGGYTRNFLFGEGGISVWAMVWSPGATTSVHDHHCSCCFGVVRGAVREVWFRPISDTHAVATGEADRGPGYVACMLPSGPNLHQMINAGSEEAVSIHVYGYDHHLHASSVDREYQIARL
ncbi:cysteine dioxygenase family protein [Enterovirga rhinocerotis]|uniref:Cysteine dioxygenase type I n=1 Tax=Enterovirga rhinocerotis TaxID=1339210 RepID=A0A4R7C742_9HYPH|nr:cysteine dioxygenase family protein [Enterovirga rhinocerotis]TDR94081.1 cysteine dioxygenase type I [Enterovirga rhinocerotis]